MENRIEINGVWYVKEDTQDKPKINKIDEDDVTNSLHCIWESDEFAFEAITILRDYAEDLTDHYNDPILKITDKRPTERKNWVDHNVDNPNWLLGLLNDEHYIIDDAKEMFNKNGIDELKLFIQHLIQKGWLIKK